MGSIIENISIVNSSHGRASDATVAYQSEVVDAFFMAKPLIDDVNHMFIILNKQRQMVYLNKLAKEFFKNDNTRKPESNSN